MFCSSAILVFCLPSHSTHILQPLDVCTFSTYQHNYSVDIDKASQLGWPSIGKHSFFHFIFPTRQRTFSNHELIQKAFRVTGIHPYNPLEVYSRPPPPEIKITLAPSNFDKEYRQACYLLSGIPECQAIQSALEKLYKQVQTAETRITVLESKTQQLEDELHKQSGGKHE